MARELTALVAPAEDQHPHGDSLLSVTSVLRHPMPSSDFCKHQACMGCTDIQTGKIHIQIKYFL